MLRTNKNQTCVLAANAYSLDSPTVKYNSSVVRSVGRLTHNPDGLGPRGRCPPLSTARVLARSRTRDTRRPRLPLSVLLHSCSPTAVYVLLQSCLEIVPAEPMYLRACKPCRRLVPARCILTGQCLRRRMKSNPQDQGGLRRIATMCGRDDDAAGHSHSENRSMRSMRRSD